MSQLEPGARYAVYAVPGAVVDDGPVAAELRALAESWYAAHPGITVDARRYGFHATLKPPVRLAAGRTPEEFDAAVGAFAAQREPVEIPAIRLATIGSFRALVPGSSGDVLGRFAGAAVRALDPFRAPLTAAEMARRNPAQLTRAQHDNLLRWGYPYVFEEFRFHMTLTDQIPPDLDGVDGAIRVHFAPVLDRDVRLNSVVVAEEPAPGEPFVVRSVHALGTVAAAVRR